MVERITFAQFDSLLAELGFRKEIVEGSHVNYWHKNWEQPFMTRLHREREIVPAYLLTGARVQFQNLGLIAASEFDAKLTPTAA